MRRGRAPIMADPRELGDEAGTNAFTQGTQKLSSACHLRRLRWAACLSQWSRSDSQRCSRSLRATPTTSRLLRSRNFRQLPRRREGPGRRDRRRGRARVGPRPTMQREWAPGCEALPTVELGREDSNLRSRDQNPLPYHLATPQCHEKSRTTFAALSAGRGRARPRSRERRRRS
jgi:hypothetical protein